MARGLCVADCAGVVGVLRRDVDVMSYAQYPKVFEQFMQGRQEFDDVSVLDTRTFLQGLKIGGCHHSTPGTVPYCRGHWLSSPALCT
jgi:hypothetical protein